MMAFPREERMPLGQMYVLRRGMAIKLWRFLAPRPRRATTSTSVQEKILAKQSRARGSAAGAAERERATLLSFPVWGDDITLASDYLLLATRHLPLTTRHLPLIPLTTYHLPLTTHY